MVLRPRWLGEVVGKIGRLMEISSSFPRRRESRLTFPLYSSGYPHRKGRKFLDFRLRGSDAVFASCGVIRSLYLCGAVS